MNETRARSSAAEGGPDRAASKLGNEHYTIVTAALSGVEPQELAMLFFKFHSKRGNRCVVLLYAKAFFFHRTSSRCLSRSRACINQEDVVRMIDAKVVLVTTVCSLVRSQSCVYSLKCTGHLGYKLCRPEETCGSCAISVTWPPSVSLTRVTDHQSPRLLFRNAAQMMESCQTERWIGKNK